MKNNNPKLAIGIILYGESTAKYLPYFLPSLENQTFKDFKIIVFNNFSNKEDENEIELKKVFPDSEILRSEENLGFAKAYNQMIKKAFEMKTEYFFSINCDMILEPDAIEKMVEAMKEDEALGSVSPKILRWDFENNKKTNIIDTYGIKRKSGLIFSDVGQGKIDNEKFLNEKIIGPSGGAGFYRMKALWQTKEKEEYFDEMMFMYKEDCDLAHKLSLVKFGSKCVKEAVIYHDRTGKATHSGEDDMAAVKNRKDKSENVKKWSLKNQLIIFMKYWHLENLWSKINIIVRVSKMFIFAFILERYLLKEFLTVWEKRDNIKIYK